MRDAADVVIVGGGVTGTSIAFHLARAGVRDIVVLERRFLAAGGTGRSVGIIRQLYPTREGDLFLCHGRVASRHADVDPPRLTCEVWATNGDGREVLRGTAVVSLPRRDSGRAGS